MAKGLTEIFKMTDAEKYEYFNGVTYEEMFEILDEMHDSLDHEMKELAMVYREVLKPTLH